MSNESGNTREHGIEFGSLSEDLESESYPLVHRELLERYGDRELVLVGESTTLGEALSPEDEREYEGPESVRQAVFNMVGEEAVGREDYSDRGGKAPEGEADRDTESF